MHWADKVAGELLERGMEHVIETGTSISGIPHVGNASDVIRGDAIRKALKAKDIDAKFIWISDDSDPFRKVPVGMEELRKYLGYPVRDIPDLNGCHKNFVEHYVEPFLSDLEKFGVKPVHYSGTDLYRKGEFHNEIITVLKNSEKVIEILNKYKTEPVSERFLPWNPICDNCGKISTTRAYEWDSENGAVKYFCEDVALAGGKAEGCGYNGVNYLKKGYGKLPWRVEWAMRWAHFRVTCEPLGKEHGGSGGSYWTSKEISREIFNWEAPIPVIYEFFTLNGEKISSSRGNVITLSDWLRIAEPEVLKFFMYKRLEKQRDINLRAIPNLVDEYDEREKVYFGLKEGGEDDKRIYELAQINEAKLLQIPFTLCAMLSQTVPDLNTDEISRRLLHQGYGNFDRERLKGRLEFARNWNELYGPDYLKFRILGDDEIETIKKELSLKVIRCLKILADELEKKWKPEELHKRIYEIARNNNLDPTEFFEWIYVVLIGRKKGPKAAMLLLTLDRNFVQNRFRSL